MQDVVERLIKEAVAQPVPGIGRQGVDGTARDKAVKRPHARLGGEVGLERLDARAERFERLFRLGQGRVGGDHQIKPVLGEQFRQFVADP